MPNYAITSEDHLYRRFSILDEPNYAVFWKFDNGRKIPTSAAFKTKPKEDGLSVNIAALTTLEDTITNYPNDAVAEFSASIPLYEGYNCLHKPSKNNKAHSIIEGDTNPIAKKLSKSVTKVFQF